MWELLGGGDRSMGVDHVLAGLAAGNVEANREIKERKEQIKKEGSKTTPDKEKIERLTSEIKKYENTIKANNEAASQNLKQKKDLTGEPNSPTAAEPAASSSGAGTPEAEAAPAAGARPNDIANTNQPFKGTIDGIPIKPDGQGGIVADRRNGTVYHQKKGETGWTIKPEEMVGGSPTNPEMTGAINTGERTVPKYKLPNGNEAFVDQTGNLQVKTKGNEHYTQGAFPEGLKANEKGRIVSIKPTVESQTKTTSASSMEGRVAAPTPVGHAQSSELVPYGKVTDVLNYGKPAPVGSSLEWQGTNYKVVANDIGTINQPVGGLIAIEGPTKGLILKDPAGNIYWASGSLNPNTPLLKPVEKIGYQWTLK